MTTDPDFSPVTGNRIRPVNDCLCSTCAALRSGEPDATPKEKPPTAGPKPRLFTIHLVDRDPMPDAPPDPTPAIVAGMIETVNREIERGLAGLRRERDEALAAVEEWRGLATCREEQLRLLHQDYAGCVGERDAAREESAARDTVAAEIRRQLFEALEDVREWKDAARKTEMTCASVDSIKSERDAARAELRAAREKHAESLCRLIDERDEARDERDRISAICKKAIAERDEARKALADEVARGQNIGIAGCDLKAGSHVVWMDSTELAALRARVAELEMERGWSLGVKKFVTADGTQYSVAEYVELMRARVAELEKTIEAAKVNPMTLFGNHSITGRTHAIDRNRSFVGVIVDVSGGKRAHVEALKHIASWL